MANDPEAPPDPDLTWSDDGSPRSGRFGDVYFSAEDGLAETRAVFLQGCGLPEAWAGRRRFTVAELGFGTGLNILALLDLWRRTRPEGALLQVFSVEAFPMSAEQAGRALARWPELAEIAAPLLSRWPPRTPGFHRLDLPELDATLDLAIMEAADALSAWSGAAEAWFLDGFSPASNPAMWREEVLDLIAARSAPGAKAATFTVAGHVRRGLQERGFAVAKRPGFGRKRERLEATFAGASTTSDIPSRVAVIGAGIGGAALIRAFRVFGLDPMLFEAAEPGAGASGNAAALVTPRLDAGGGAVAMLYAQAFERAVELYLREASDAVLAQGVLQLEHQDRDGRRFDAIAAQSFWPPNAVACLDAASMTARLGETQARGGLALNRALVIEPRTLLRAWLRDTRRIQAQVAAVERREGAWVVLDANGVVLAEAEILCLAGGWGNAALRPDLLLAPVRGQATTAAGQAATPPLAWGGYVVPTRDGMLFGATHDRGDTAQDLRLEDDRRNLESLARVLPALARRLEQQALQGRAAIRAVTPDRLPLAGPLDEGLYVLGGLGSRGFCLAPLLAEHVAAIALGAASPLPSTLARLVEPDRFA